MKGYYVLQFRLHDWDPWETCNHKFETLAEARTAFEKLHIKAGYRIAEAYTVTRYKAVKV